MKPLARSHALVKAESSEPMRTCTPALFFLSPLLLTWSRVPGPESNAAHSEHASQDQFLQTHPQNTLIRQFLSETFSKTTVDCIALTIRSITQGKHITDGAVLITPSKLLGTFEDMSTMS